MSLFKKLVKVTYDEASDCFKPEWVESFVDLCPDPEQYQIPDQYVPVFYDDSSPFAYPVQVAYFKGDHPFEINNSLKAAVKAAFKMYYAQPGSLMMPIKLRTKKVAVDHSGEAWVWEAVPQNIAVTGGTPKAKWSWAGIDWSQTADQSMDVAPEVLEQAGADFAQAEQAALDAAVQFKKDVAKYQSEKFVKAYEASKLSNLGHNPESIPEIKIKLDAAAIENDTTQLQSHYEPVPLEPTPAEKANADELLKLLKESKEEMLKICGVPKAKAEMPEAKWVSSDAYKKYGKKMIDPSLYGKITLAGPSEQYGCELPQGFVPDDVEAHDLCCVTADMSGSGIAYKDMQVTYDSKMYGDEQVDTNHVLFAAGVTEAQAQKFVDRVNSDVDEINKHAGKKIGDAGWMPHAFVKVSGHHSPALAEPLQKMVWDLSTHVAEAAASAGIPAEFIKPHGGVHGDELTFSVDMKKLAEYYGGDSKLAIKCANMFHAALIIEQEADATLKVQAHNASLIQEKLGEAAYVQYLQAYPKVAEFIAEQELGKNAVQLGVTTHEGFLDGDDIPPEAVLVEINGERMFVVGDCVWDEQGEPQLTPELV